MSIQNRIINHFSDSAQIQQDIMAELGEMIELASQRMVASLLNDGKIFTCGNGRSASAASLMAAILLNQYERDRPSLPAIALTSDIITMTAIANQQGYDEIFTKPLRSLGQSVDILVTFTDGNVANNIANAITVAHHKEIPVIALTDEKSEIISDLLIERDLEIRIPSHSSSHTHEAQTLITNCLCDLIDYQLFQGIN